MHAPLCYPFPILHLRPAAPQCRLCVTVPAKNEEEYIVDTLEALRLQTDASGAPLDPALYEVILLANNCSDATARIADEYAARHPNFRLHVGERQLPPEIACVGTARRILMDTAYDRLGDSGIICTTDADTRVDSEWVYQTLRAFDRGAKAVGGRIIVPAGRKNGYRKIHLQDVTYRMLQAKLESIIDPSSEDPWPRHFQHYGPSAAIRADMYGACGGIPPLKAIEDVALSWALERIDVNFVHDLAIRVYTSDRKSGRIDGVAFSGQIEEWAKMVAEGRKPVVFGLNNCIRLFKWKVALRQAFRERRIGRSVALYELADYLEMKREELEGRIANAETFGALYQDIRQLLEATHEFSDSTFDRAITDLRRFTRGHPTCSRHQSGTFPPARYAAVEMMA